MYSFKRKYKELNDRSRIIFWFAFLIILLIISAGVYALFLSGQLTLQRTYPLKGSQEHVYRNLASFDRITEWIKGLRVDSSTDTLHLADLDSVVFYNPHNRPVVITITRREPFCNVEWNVHVNNRTYGILFYDKYLTDTTSELCIQVKTPLTKWQALGSFMLIDSIHYHMDRLARELNASLFHQKSNYRLTYQGTMSLDQKPYLLAARQVDAQEFTKNLVHYLPEILIYGIKNGLYNRKAKLILMRKNTKNGKIYFATGFQLLKKPDTLPPLYHIGYLPKGTYAAFWIEGDYLYHPYARNKAQHMLHNRGMSYDTSRPFIYRYLVGHSKFPKNPEKWETILYLPVKNQ